MLRIASVIITAFAGVQLGGYLSFKGDWLLALITFTIVALLALYMASHNSSR